MEAFNAGFRAFLAVRLPMVEGLVARRVSRSEERENVVQDILVSALESSPKISGSRTGEFVNWLRTIAKRRIDDYIDRQARLREREYSADAPVPGDEDAYVPEIADSSDEHGAVPMRELVGEVLAERSPLHRRAIELRLDGHPSREVAEMLSREGEAISPANVDQVFSRFRTDVRAVTGETGV